MWYEEDVEMWYEEGSAAVQAFLNLRSSSFFYSLFHFVCVFQS
tara:strand:- start:667 stop:795 length:129 start_codon:yes stop_codon:yes gene_type:complete